MDRKQLLRIIEALTEADFDKLIFNLDVPNGKIPSAQQEQTIRAIELLNWANSPTGCNLQEVVEELREMGAITPEEEAKITNQNTKTGISPIVSPKEDTKINPPKKKLYSFSSYQ